VRRSYANAA